MSISYICRQQYVYIDKERGTGGGKEVEGEEKLQEKEQGTVKEENHLCRTRKKEQQK
jgi:hypothetical protein